MSKNILIREKFDRFIRHNSFFLAGEIYVQRPPKEGHIKFRINDAMSDGTGWVYIWVWPNAKNKTVEIKYIGMAGKTTKKRFHEQAHGFKTSPTGRKHAQKIKALLTGDNQLSIYVRHAKRVHLFGENISNVASEEVALIAKFDPPWNKIHRRAVEVT